MPTDMAPKLNRPAACRGAAALMDALNQIGGSGTDEGLAKRVVDAELDLQELVIFSLAMLALGR